VVDSCEHGNEPSGPIKDGEHLDYLSDCQLHQQNFAPGVSEACGLCNVP
jgi:hypothetical protein